MLQTDSNVLTDFRKLRLDILACHNCTSARWGHSSSKHVNSCRFAGAVVPKQCCNLTRVHGKAQFIDGRLVPKWLYKLPNLNALAFMALTLKVFTNGFYRHIRIIFNIVHLVVRISHRGTPVWRKKGEVKWQRLTVILTDDTHKVHRKESPEDGTGKQGVDGVLECVSTGMIRLVNSIIGHTNSFIFQVSNLLHTKAKCCNGVQTYEADDALVSILVVISRW